MIEHLKEKWMHYVYVAFIVVLAVATLRKQPVKVSIMENVFVEVGTGEAGPPEFYRFAVTLPDGREVYLSDGSCRVKEAP